VEAARLADWGQVASNGGPPCFHLEGGRFCLRAERWDGHGPVHVFISLADLLLTSLNARDPRTAAELAKLRRMLRAACSTIECQHAMGMASGEVRRWRRLDLAGKGR
jgi:hypothetical protein